MSGRSADDLRDPVPTNPVRQISPPIPGPVDQKCLAFDLLALDITPKAAIQALIPIIAHHEIRVRWNGERTEVITRLELMREHRRIHMLRIRFGLWLTID